MKSRFSMAVSIVLGLLLLSCSDASKQFDFRFDYDNKAYVVGLNGPEYLEVLKIPPTVRNKDDGKKYTVVGIDRYAFGGEDLLEEVYLPKTISVIEEDAFEDCYRLRKVVFPDSISFIAKGAFNGCISLEEVVGLKNKEAISYGAFEGCIRLKNRNDLLPHECIVKFHIEDFEPAHVSSAVNYSNFQCNMCNGFIIRSGHDLITKEIVVPQGETWVYRDHDADYLCGNRKGWFTNPYIIIKIRGREKKYQLPEDGRDFTLQSGDTFQIGTYFAHGYFEYVDMSVVFSVQYYDVLSEEE